MKKIINRTERIVAEMCHGMVLAHPELSMDEQSGVIRRREMNREKVTLIGGGGSGHEPAHAGFVGRGMLDAAVCGEVFASPSQIQVYRAIRRVAGDAGVLLIIKNYSGDVMNFKNAAELAAEDGIDVAHVTVADDIAVEDSLFTVGRRGVAGTVFVHKIAGAAAERGEPLQSVRALAQKTADRVRSIGFALTSCTVPAKGSPTFLLAEGEMEFGVGIHGEPGVRREAVMTSKALAERTVAMLCKELALKKGDRIALLVNGFGATPLMELYLHHHDVMAALSEKGVAVARAFVGNYMTSIDMAGASLSVLLLDDELEVLLNEPCDTVALKVSGPSVPAAYQPLAEDQTGGEPFCYAAKTPKPRRASDGTVGMEEMIYMVDVMSESIIQNEVAFCELDARAGDGDFGMSLAGGFRELKRRWPSVLRESGTVGGFLDACSLIMMEYCGGASGPIWGSAFRAAGKYAGGRTALSVKEFAGMLQAAVEGIQATGERAFGRGAVVGDKTLIDALAPAADCWQKAAESGCGMAEAFQKGAKAARDGAKATEGIAARMGRAGALGARSIGYPDAGAHALGVIFTAIAAAMTGESAG